MTTRKTIAVVGVVLALLVGALWGFYCYEFPLGMKHQCDLDVWFGLLGYAETHDGWFPRGEATPEASLGLIGADHFYTLCPRAGSVELVRDILQRGDRLTPETCGWNYVEGLRKDSNPALALFWDKEGLGHNGQRLSGGGHVVTFVNGTREHIPAAAWSRFLEKQRKLLAEETRRVGPRAENSNQPMR